ncbi:hypothetical protein CCM_06699 [Cordyceps militaris CM01]|uniref:Uncharacterized protein n=2 Tax=Cordyceps militaris TaxID=73501 RepID=G3JNA0_CORMM|nr:uncharacterized protein CCM_06699 [Cordyceps militaris CM01]EGX90282.1 hypothetical protein CCM_06699 [Cordyceps militaris CM01]
MISCLQRFSERTADPWDWQKGKSMPTDGAKTALTVKILGLEKRAQVQKVEDAVHTCNFGGDKHSVLVPVLHSPSCATESPNAVLSVRTGRSWNCQLRCSARAYITHSPRGRECDQVLPPVSMLALLPCHKSLLPLVAQSVGRSQFRALSNTNTLSLFSPWPRVICQGVCPSKLRKYLPAFGSPELAKDIGQHCRSVICAIAFVAVACWRNVNVRNIKQVKGLHF